MHTDRLAKTLSLIAHHFDGCKVGYQGVEGYRKSTDLHKLARCARELADQGFLDPRSSVFLDLGCADGRVNLLMSYFVRKSIGIEIDASFLAEYDSRKRELEDRLDGPGLLPPPDNVSLFHGSSLDPQTYDRILSKTGVRFEEVHLFYTYITLHDAFAQKIAEEASPGALYLVYGFHNVLPRYDGLDLLAPDPASQEIMALYWKPPFAAEPASRGSARSPAP